MRIIIEEHQYPADTVRKVLDGITTLRDIEGKVSVNYVGYYYNPTLKDTVFILPKVVLGKKLDEEGKEIENSISEYVFGKYEPESIINLDEDNVKNLLDKNEHDFLYELSVWIYRAIVVFRDCSVDSSIVLQQNVQQMSKGRLQKCNTFLDILLALLKFNRENQDFFFFILKNIHSGYNKINWNRTISHSQSFIQGGTPVYLNPVNKKKKINFDEELLIIFFSILSYINEHYGFPVKINVNFPLIKGAMFENYRNGMGKVRLMQIKYKYFSDKALYLWELCYAFFDQSKKINVETDDKEYLLVKNFNIVFEAIIDELIGDPREKIPNGLKDQPDGKRVDHIYKWRELTNNTNEDQIYYIGDSKYYKRSTPVGTESVYKQFTYARNVIQWNMDIFNSNDESEQEKHVRLRDEITEGYNITPNFFISAHQKELEASSKITKNSDNSDEPYQSIHYTNRLFDRDTLLINHYDVNFLFVLALYGRNNKGEKAAWKNKVRDIFRTDIQKILSERYDFYAMKPKMSDDDCKAFIKDHFKELNGKIFRPYQEDTVYSLALEKVETGSTKNSAPYKLLSDYFEIEPVKSLGNYPKDELNQRVDTYLFQHGPKPYFSATKPNTYIADKALVMNVGSIAEGQMIALGAGRSDSALDYVAKLQGLSYIVLFDRTTSIAECYEVQGPLKMQLLNEVKKWPYTKDSNFYVTYKIGEEKKNLFNVGVLAEKADELFCNLSDIVIDRI